MADADFGVHALEPKGKSVERLPGREGMFMQTVCNDVVAL
jgi:hypothetical protein